MNVPDIDTHEALAFEELKPLANADGPCITAVVPLPDPSQIGVQLKNAYRGILNKLAENATSSSTDELIAPIRTLMMTAKSDRLWAHALILFRSPGLFRYYLLHGQFDQAQMVEQRFLVRPVLRTLAHETRFHLLALSQRHVRLLHCTQHRCEPATGGESIPQDMRVWENTRQPDHRLASRSVAGPSVGRMKGVVSGTDADRERHDRYMAHFFKDVDKGVTAHLRQDTGPLLLAGVERDVAIYRRVNSYRRTLEKTVNGSPDGMTDRTLHERVMEVMTSVLSEQLIKVMADVREHAGTPRSSTDPCTVVQAAFQGRVSDLLISANAAYWGSWNEEKQLVDNAVRREELLNAAALQTFGHDGRAFVLDDSDMPVQAPAIALFRY